MSEPNYALHQNENAAECERLEKRVAKLETWIIYLEDALLASMNGAHFDAVIAVHNRHAEEREERAAKSKVPTADP